MLKAILSALLSIAYPCAVHPGDNYTFRIDEDRLDPALIVNLNHPLTIADKIHARDGHFYTIGADLVPGTEDDRRMRFFGVNLSPPLVFPRSDAEADKLARRLSHLGFNLVRIHALDSNRVQPYRTLLTTSSGASYPEFDQSHLTALDRLFNSFLKHGIYVDLVLKVGYTFNPHHDCIADQNEIRCVPDPTEITANYLQPGRMPSGSYSLDLFDETMRALQKEYFAALVTRYRDHIALALVETNNENSLIEIAWKNPEPLPPLYAEALDRHWNDWLKRRYETTAIMLAAWAQGQKQGSEQIINGNFHRQQKGVPLDWELLNWEYQGERDWGSWRVVEPSILEIIVKKPPPRYWYYLIGQRGLKITKGKFYRIRFKAWADAPRRIGVDIQGLGTHQAASAIPGMGREIHVGKKPIDYEICFKASYTDHNARLSFLPVRPGGKSGRLWLQEVSLKPVAPQGPPNDRTLEQGNIPRPSLGQKGQCSSGVGRPDYLRFLAEIEHDYYEDMRAFLHDKIGLQRPVSGTQANYGGLLAQNNFVSQMDFLDVHFYWNHPHIPRPRMENWWMRDVPMVSHPNESVLKFIAETRVTGKPLVITEYSPNQLSQYAAEGPLLTAAYSALQDIDGIVLFNYYETGGDTRNKLDPDRLLFWYNILGEPRAELLIPFAARIFRRGDVQPAREVVEVSIGKDLRLAQAGERNIMRYLSRAIKDRDGNAFSQLIGATHRLALKHVSGLTPPVTQKFDIPNGSEARSDTGELLWHWGDGKTDSWFTIDTQHTQVTGGFLRRRLKLSNLEVEGMDGEDQFGIVAISSLDGKPIATSRDLVLVTLGKGKGRNLRRIPQGKGVTYCVPGTSGRCVRPFWDKAAGPFELEPNPVRIRLTSKASGVQVERLDSRGRALGQVAVSTVTGGYSWLAGGAGEKTPWYRIRLQ